MISDIKINITMKTFNKVLSAAAIVIATTFGVNAQSSNNTDPNANYKHQIPVSKGNKFKDSFDNSKAEDASVHNYKQQQPKRNNRVAKNQNFATSNKQSTANSKHPYGL
jgi:hypothetical protein